MAILVPVNRNWGILTSLIINKLDKVQSVCILRFLTNACNFNEYQELVLQNQWARCLCGLHLRRRYATRSTYWSLSVSYCENRKEVLGNDL
jgi:hypothetical protein